MYFFKVGLILVIPCTSSKLDFRYFVTSLLLITIHTNMQIMDIITLHQNMETNYVIIFYVST
jgi:hypothetical protein